MNQYAPHKVGPYKDASRRSRQRWKAHMKNHTAGVIPCNGEGKCRFCRQLDGPVFSSGDKVYITVPSTLPEPYSEFSDRWIKWVNSLGTKIFHLQAHKKMGVAPLLDKINGWHLKGSPKPDDNATCAWVPTEWIRLASTKPKSGTYDNWNRNPTYGYITGSRILAKGHSGRSLSAQSARITSAPIDHCITFGASAEAVGSPKQDKLELDLKDLHKTLITMRDSQTVLRDENKKLHAENLLLEDKLWQQGHLEASNRLLEAKLRQEQEKQEKLSCSDVLQIAVSDEYAGAAQEVALTKARVETNLAALAPGMLVWHVFSHQPYMLVEESRSGNWIAERPDGQRIGRLHPAVLRTTSPSFLNKTGAWLGGTTNKVGAAFTAFCIMLWGLTNNVAHKAKGFARDATRKGNRAASMSTAIGLIGAFIAACVYISAYGLALPL